MSDTAPAQARDQFARPDRARKSPRGLRRYFPLGPLRPLPWWLSCPAPCQLYNEIPLYAGVLRGLVFRFSGKRCRKDDVLEIAVIADGGRRIWQAGASVARALEYFTTGERAPRGYVLVSFSDPAARILGIELARLRRLEARIEFGELAREQRVEWWGVYL